MFIAMNRSQVKKGCEHDFEHVWLSRDTHLGAVPGFIEFHLLKGRSAKNTSSTLRTRSGAPTKTSRPGPSQSIFARRTPAPGTTNHSIWATPNSKGLTSSRLSPKTVTSALLLSSTGCAKQHEPRFGFRMQFLTH